MQTEMKPAPLRGTGLKALFIPANSFEISPFTPQGQASLAVERLVRRFGMSASTASAVAAANCWGGR